MTSVPTVIGGGTHGVDANGERITPGLSSESRVRKSKAGRPGSEHHGTDLSHKPAFGSSGRGRLAAGHVRQQTVAAKRSRAHSIAMLTNPRIRLLPLLAATILWPAFAQAEEPKVGQPSDKTDRPVWTLTLENDLTNDTDRYFTNGIRLSRTSPVGDVPESVIDFVQPLIGTVGTVRWTASIGQNMYSPSDITVKNPDPGDQPYAAWLYGSVGLLNDLATGDGKRTQTSG